MIPSTKPYLPKLEHYHKRLEQIWETGWITNNGPMVTELEARVARFLDVPFLSFVSSGGMGLQLSLHTLKKKGQIITTPFSYVATTSAIVWEGFTPVFADVNPTNFNIDPQRVKAAITKNTVCILATHIYGNACEVEALNDLSEEYGLPVIYDAAHCFGSTLKEKSLLNFGDIAVLSTHATKLFHTVNGGFVATRSIEMKQKIDSMRNYGHIGINHFQGAGINGKNSEFHAAMGLCLMENAEELLETRKKQWNYYRTKLSGGIYELMDVRDERGFNGAYFPIICPTINFAVKISAQCQENGIELRKYFNPSLNRLSYVNYTSCLIAEALSERVLCLPLYHDLTFAEQDQVIHNLKME